MTSAEPTKRPYRIVLMGADGIGPEVVHAAAAALRALTKKMGSFSIDYTDLPWGTAYYKEHGRYIPEDALETLQRHDAILFGSVGAPGR